MKFLNAWISLFILFNAFCVTSYGGDTHDQEASASKEEARPKSPPAGIQNINLEDQKKIETLLEECRTMTMNPTASAASGNCDPKDLVDDKRAQLNKKLNECTGSRSIYKFCTTFGKGFFSTVIKNVAAQYVATQCLQYSAGIDFNNNEHAMAAKLTAATGAVVTSMDTAWNAWQTCAITEFEAMKQVDDALRKAEKKQFDILPEDFKKQVKRINQELDQKYKQGALDNSPAAEPVRKLIMQREMFYMMFPHKTKDVSRNSPDLSDEDKSQINAEISKILIDYPENKAELSVLIDQIRSISSPSIKKPKRVQRYFYGPPGTGKTTLLNRIAKALGLYLCKISANDLKPQQMGGSTDGLTGAGYLSQDDDPKVVLGKLGQCYREAGHTNFILAIDELGDTFRSINRKQKASSNAQSDMIESYNINQIMEKMKTMLDEGEPQVPFKGLGVNADFSRMTVIGAGNFHIPDEAILRRMPETRFPPLKPVQKAIAFQDGYKSALHGIVEAGSLSSEQASDTKEVVDNYLEYISEQDKQFPGGGIIKGVLAEIFTFVSGEIRDGKKPSEFLETDVKGHINRMFESRKESLSDAD